MFQPKCVILFGAGASHACRSCMPHPPPLGSELLKEVRAFQPVVWRGLGALNDSNAQFESTMDVRISEKIDIVPYLKSLGEYFALFHADDDDLYARLSRSLKNGLMSKDIVFASLNYDLLLDRAMLRELGGVNYAEDGKSPHLIKVHGSCNWPTSHSNVVAPSLSVTMDGDGNGSFDFDPKPCFEPPEILSSMISKDISPPVMRVYSSRKPMPIGESYLKKRENQFKTMVAGAKRVIVVGSRINFGDDHVWGEISRTAANVTLVNRGEENRHFIECRGNPGDRWIDGFFEERWREMARTAKASYK